MNSRFVSVIVPCLNRKAWLQEAIASLQKQSYPAESFEIIVVDNGSTDGAWEWLQEASRSSRISVRCFRNESPVRTHSSSRTFGLRHARGEIIGFTDSDCLAAPDWIEKGVARFEGDVGMVVGKTIPPPTDPVGPLSRIRLVEAEGFFDTCNIFYARQALDRTGGFTSDLPRFKFTVYGDDFELGIRVKSAGYQSRFAEDAVVMHRVVQLTPWQWLIEPRVLLHCHSIVKKHSSIRRDLLFLRYFLNRMTALFDLLLLGLVLAWWISPWFLLLSMPFAVAKFREGGKHLNPIMRVVRVGAGTVRAGVFFGVLLYGSIRYRCLVI